MFKYSNDFNLYEVKKIIEEKNINEIKNTNLKKSIIYVNTYE